MSSSRSWVHCCRPVKRLPSRAASTTSFGIRSIRIPRPIDPRYLGRSGEQTQERTRRRRCRGNGPRLDSRHRGVRFDRRGSGLRRKVDPPGDSAGRNGGDLQRSLLCAAGGRPPGLGRHLRVRVPIPQSVVRVLGRLAVPGGQDCVGGHRSPRVRRLRPAGARSRPRAQDPGGGCHRCRRDPARGSGHPAERGCQCRAGDSHDCIARLVHHPGLRHPGGS